ncbi:hypothetical protein [Shimia marina]|nr:hypothetical protein [Shimia marina]
MIRTYVSLMLVAVLVLTGHSMAIARGMPGAQGYAEYCIGETPVMVPVDAEGNPTGAPHLCPDASFSLLNWVDVAPGVAAAPVAFVRLVQMSPNTLPPVIRVIASTARAPPTGVSLS